MAEDTARNSIPENKALYSDAYDAYDKQTKEAQAAYENMAREARINKAMIERAREQADAAAGITRKAAVRTSGQRNENSLRNALGGVNRQYENYQKNVEHALNNLKIQEAADEKSFDARRESERNANRLSQGRFNAEYGLQKKQLDLFKEESDFNKAYELFLRRMINKNKFKGITGIKVKSLPKPPRPRNIFADMNKGTGVFAQLAASGQATNEAKAKYLQDNKAELIKKYGEAQYQYALGYFDMKKEDANLGSISAAVKELDRIIGTCGTKNEAALYKFYKEFRKNYSAAAKEIYGKPAFIPPGTDTSNLNMEDYIEIPFSAADKNSKKYYVSAELNDTFNVKGISFYDENTQKLKSEGRLMLEYLGISVGMNVDYNIASAKIEDNRKDIISLFGINNYYDVKDLAAMKSWCDQYEATSLCPTVNKLENLMIYSIGDTEDIPGMLDIAKGEVDNLYKEWSKLSPQELMHSPSMSNSRLEAVMAQFTAQFKQDPFGTVKALGQIKKYQDYLQSPLADPNSFVNRVVGLYAKQLQAEALPNTAEANDLAMQTEQAKLAELQAAYDASVLKEQEEIRQAYSSEAGRVVPAGSYGSKTVRQLGDSVIKKQIDESKTKIQALKNNKEWAIQADEKQRIEQDIMGRTDFQQITDNPKKKYGWQIGDPYTGQPIERKRSGFDFGSYYTDDERRILTYLKEKGDEETYRKYYKSLRHIVNERETISDQLYIQNVFEGNDGWEKARLIFGSIIEMPNSIAALGESGYQTIENAITGKYKPIDPYSDIQQMAARPKYIRGVALKDAGEWGQFFGNAAFSIVDMGLTLPLDPIGSLSLMAAEAAGQQANDVVQRGGTAEQAFLEGAIYGTIAAATEKLPIDDLFRIAKSGTKLLSKEGLKNVLKQAGLNGTEEWVEETLDVLADYAVMGDKSQLGLRISELMNRGMNEQEARQKAGKELLIEQPLYAFGGGVLSGGVVGSGANVVSGLNSRTPIGQRIDDVFSTNPLSSPVYSQGEQTYTQPVGAIPEQLAKAPVNSAENILPPANIDPNVIVAPKVQTSVNDTAQEIQLLSEKMPVELFNGEVKNAYYQFGLKPTNVNAELFYNTSIQSIDNTIAAQKDIHTGGKLTEQQISELTEQREHTQKRLDGLTAGRVKASDISAQQIATHAEQLVSALQILPVNIKEKIGYDSLFDALLSAQMNGGNIEPGQTALDKARAGIGAALDTPGLNLRDRVQLEAVKTGIDNIDSEEGKGDNTDRNEGVKFFRVQGGVGSNRSKYRVIVEPDGDVRIPDKKQKLYISIGSSEHALYFKAKRGEGAVIVEFEAPRWLYDFIKENAISQKNYKDNILNQSKTAPKIVDPTTPGESYELPLPWIEWLEEYADKGKLNK